jgi:putative SOS response-associated peptidase YedK
MRGRFTQTDSGLPGLDSVISDPEIAAPPRYNGALSQEFRVIWRHPETGLYHRDRLVWGLIPS